MSHSITTAASYTLIKYSRSYPSIQATQAPVESEWQHFTNPVMGIILEAKKSPSGRLLSMRLRISWSIQAGPDDFDTNQKEIVFEDLELLSFSSLPSFQISTTLQSDQSLPLKAVYRDAVVGIRYLHPKIVPPGSQPTYRRFQITFKDAVDASQCIDAIKSVCPCKANPQPAPINRHPTTLSCSLTRTSTAVSGPAAARPTRLPECQGITLAPNELLPPLVSMVSHPPEKQALSIPPSVATSLSSDDSAFVTCSETSQKADAKVDRYRKDGQSKGRARDSAHSPLPNSSQPSSSDRSVTMPPPPLPQRAAYTADATIQPPSETVNTCDQRPQLLASLSQHHSLYELSRTDLESLVSQVIREEGFLCLLESLDSLWRVKGFLGR